MSDTPASRPSAPSDESELRAQCADLQSQAHTLRVVLLFVVGALCLFFWREASFNGRIAMQLQPQALQATQFAEILNKQGSSMEKQFQAVQTAVKSLVDYARTHPDYVPILNKYGIPVPTATNSAPAAAAPAVPTPAAPKK